MWFAGAGGALVASAARGGRQRFVEAPGRAAGSFATARRALAGFAFVGCPVAARVAVVAFVTTRCARWTLRAVRTFAVAAFYGFREGAFATLAFEAARGAIAVARAAFGAAALLRRTAIAAEARTIGGIALPAYRTIATHAAFRRTARARARTAERAAFAIVAARRAVTETARCAITAIRTALEPARCAFVAFACAFEATRRAFGTLTGFAAWRALAAFTRAFETTRCAFGTLAGFAAWRAIAAFTRAFEATRRAFGTLTGFAARRALAAFTRAFEATRCAFGTLAAFAATFEPARRASNSLTRRTTLTVGAARNAFAALPGTCRPPRRACGIRASLTRKRRPLGTRRPRTAARRLTARGPLRRAIRRRAFTRRARLRQRRLGPCRTGRLTRRRTAGANRGALGRCRPRMLGC
ncbi:hypothetical protein [Paraburkholderia sp.]|uniref:hypothetical protein n=1 Tax=Paraburkholderia sp. TaxID=1926495 RepID=UPI0039E49546